jgi:hypothetical protein
MEQNLNTNTNSSLIPQTLSENSSINEKNRKLFIKIQSLISSAQNFETLKFYEE